jgi:hypothetical protein
VAQPSQKKNHYHTYAVSALICHCRQGKQSYQNNSSQQSHGTLRTVYWLVATPKQNTSPSAKVWFCFPFERVAESC